MVSSMSKGAVHEGPDFPSELWDERAKKEMREVVVRCWWVSPTNGAPMPDKALNESSPDRTGNFTFAANPAELMNLPAWLQTTHAKTGYWYLDFHEQGSGRYFLRWKVYLGAPQNMAQGIGGNVVAGMSVAEQIAARSGAPPGMSINGSQQQVLAPGTQVWSRELNTWVMVSGSGQQHTLGGGSPADPAIAALASKLEQMERTNADRATADRHSAELTREREAAEKREALIRDEMKALREAVAAPRESTIDKLLPAITALVPELLAGRRADAAAAETRALEQAKSQQTMFELMLKQNQPAKTDPLMIEMMKLQTAQVAAQRGSDVQLYESLARSALEQGTMQINLFKALKEAEPDLNPIAETVGKTFMGVAHEIGSYFRSKATMPGLPADAGGGPPLTLQDQVNQAVGTFNKLTPDQQMELANYMAGVAAQRAAAASPQPAGASTPPPTVTPAPGSVNPAVTVTADAGTADAVPPPPPSNGTASAVTTDQVRAYLISQKVDAAYVTPEWLRILTDLHNQRAEEEISAMLADHLLHLWRFGTLPEGLEVLDPKEADIDDVLDDMRMRLDLFMQMLPIYKTAPAYINGVMVRAFGAYVEGLGGDEEEEEGVTAEAVSAN